MTRIGDTHGVGLYPHTDSHTTRNDPFTKESAIKGMNVVPGAFTVGPLPRILSEGNMSNDTQESTTSPRQHSLRAAVPATCMDDGDKRKRSEVSRMARIKENGQIESGSEGDDVSSLGVHGLNEDIEMDVANGTLNSANNNDNRMN